MSRRASTSERLAHAARHDAGVDRVRGLGVDPGIVIVLLVLAFQGSDPAAPVAEPPGAVRQVGEQFFVPVEVDERGDEGAAQVQVQAELTIGGETSSADQVIDFLGRGETRALTFVFEHDPAGGELAIGVVSFAAP